MNSPNDFIIAQTREVYGHIALEFSNTRSFIREDIKLFARYIKDGDNVLDIGCGNGRLNLLLKDKRVTYTGIDQSSELIAIAQQKFLDAMFMHADMRELPLPDASFDIIFCIAAFHHLPDDASRLQALSEMKRVLKPRGKIILSQWNLYSAWAAKKYGPGKNGDFRIPWKDASGKALCNRYYHSFTFSELELLFKKSGLQLEEQYYVKKGERSDIQEGENIVSILTAGD